MRVKDYKCKCGHNDFFFADKGNQIGIYCSYCGKWYKWAYKDEQNLILKQEPLLDKIRAEIGQLRNFSAENYDLEQYCDCFDARIIFRDDVLQIIDKYRGESDCRECKVEYDCYECEKYTESEEKDAT